MEKERDKNINKERDKVRERLVTTKR